MYFIIYVFISFSAYTGLIDLGTIKLIRAGKAIRVYTYKEI